MIKLFVHNGIKHLLEDENFPEINIVKIIWVTIDKISRDLIENQNTQK